MPGSQYVTRESVHSSITLQPPRDAAVGERMDRVRDSAHQFVDAIFDECPETPERSLAIREFESALMWAVKSIAVNQDQIPG